MRLYHQIYDNEHLNKWYDVDLNNPPTGYGAVPYSHGFVRNKLTPKPFGVRVPAMYSRCASAGGRYIEDSITTDIYKDAYTTGIGLSIDFSPRIFGNLFGATAFTANIGNPYNYGPVATMYEVMVSGIKNHNIANNPSGCLFCDGFNQRYIVYADNLFTNEFTGNVNTNYVDPYLLGINTLRQNADRKLNVNIGWTNNSTCTDPYTFPRSSLCTHRYNLTHPSETYGLSAKLPFLMLAEMVDASGKIPSYPGQSGYPHNIVLSFSLQPGNGDLDNPSASPVLRPASPDMYLGLHSYKSPFIFAHNFGEFNILHPSGNYIKKPNMLDDRWIELFPMTSGKWYFYDRHFMLGSERSVFDAQKSLTNRAMACDFSEARCFIRPFKSDNPLGVIANLADQSYRGIFKPIWENSAGIGGVGFYTNPFSGFVPRSFSLTMDIDNHDGIDSPYCDSCSGYYNKRRDLIRTGDAVNLAFGAHFPMITAGYISGLRNEIFGIAGITHSGLNRQQYIWRGYTDNLFLDIQPAYPHGTQSTKLSLNNLSNICEFGCAEEMGGPLSPQLDVVNCNNQLHLDIIYNYYAKASGGANEYPWEFKSWTDANLYFGQAYYDEFVVYPIPNMSVSPYRLTKRICDDRTGVPTPCSDIKMNGRGLHHFGGEVFHHPAYISAISGILNTAQPWLSGNWSYERWTNNPYENYPNIGSILSQIEYHFTDLSGLCNFEQADAYIMPNYNENHVDCQNNNVQCAICNNGTIPTSVTITLTSAGGSESYILNKIPFSLSQDTHIIPSLPGLRNTSNFGINVGGTSKRNDYGATDMCLFHFNDITDSYDINGGISPCDGTLSDPNIGSNGIWCDGKSITLHGINWWNNMEIGVFDPTLTTNKPTFNLYINGFTSLTSSIITNSGICSKQTTFFEFGGWNNVWSSKVQIHLPEQPDRFNMNSFNCNPISVTGTLVQQCIRSNWPFGNTEIDDSAIPITIDIEFGDFVNARDYL